MTLTAAKVKATLARQGVNTFKVKKKHSGVFEVEFRRDDGKSLASADALAYVVTDALGNATVVAKHEWHRDWQPGNPRAVVLVEIRIGTAAAVTARKAAQATA